ncbi:MAG: glycosyltransferase family 39 protein [Planctomycetota bacterium]|nr:glycosyltransferase family 39 protein [Planctomycetota bacterium]
MTGWLADVPPRRRHLLFAGVCVAAVYLIGVTGQWWPSPDSALYLGLARSLAEGDGYRFNDSPSNIVTPGLPLILAGMQMVFGEGFWAPNLFMALCGLAAAGLIYLSTARISDRRTALAVTLATALSYTFFHQSHRILTDAPFAALFWAILYSYIRYRTGSVRWLIPAGLFSAAAVAVRAPGILFLGSLAVGILPDLGPTRPVEVPQTAPKNRKGLIPAFVILLVIAVMGAGFFIVARSADQGMPMYAGAVISRVNVGLTEHLRSLWLGIMQLPLALSEMLTSQEAYSVGLPALILMCVGGVSLWRRRQRFVLPVIVVSVLALALYGRDHFIRPRYLMPIQPLLLLAIMEGLCRSIKLFRPRARPALHLKAVIVLVGAIVACNAPKLLRNAVYYSYVSHTGRYHKVVMDGRFAELFPVAGILREGDHADRTAAADSDKVSMLHYLSRRTIIPLPETARISPDEAEVIRHFAASHSDLQFIVLDVGKRGGSEPFRRRLRELFENTPGMELRRAGKRYLVYEVLIKPGRSASRPSAPDKKYEKDTSVEIK